MDICGVLGPPGPHVRRVAARGSNPGDDAVSQAPIAPSSNPRAKRNAAFWVPVPRGPLGARGTVSAPRALFLKLAHVNAIVAAVSSQVSKANEWTPRNVKASFQIFLLYTK